MFITNGHRFATFAEALAHANAYFARTGVILGIERSA
jgi:hypothetical protein